MQTRGSFRPVQPLLPPDQPYRAYQACLAWKRAVSALVALAAVLLIASAASAQTRYARGQNVVPVYEGYHKNADGTFTMVFGYMNRNYEEELDIPIGPDNVIEPPLLGQGPDGGQPTHFYTRRQQFAFSVTVPKDWGKKDLVWTLNIRGKAEKAYGTLQPFWELGSLVYEENRGSISEIGEEPEDNKPPTIALTTGNKATVKVGQPLKLSVNVTDDGKPTPRKARPGAAPPVRRDSDGAVITPTGTPGPGGSGPRRENPLTQAVVRVDPGVTLGVTWIVYRGSSDGVAFAPQRIAVKDGKADATVTFAKPGTYTLRGYADDTVLLTPADVVVTVN